MFDNHCFFRGIKYNKKTRWRRSYAERDNENTIEYVNSFPKKKERATVSFYSDTDGRVYGIAYKNGI